MLTTNEMRVLDKKKITYTPYCYEESGETNGEKAARTEMVEYRTAKQNVDKILGLKTEVGKYKNQPGE